MSAPLILASVSLAVWIYLLLFRGFFWLPRTLPRAPAPSRLPSVAAVVPARNEAATVGAAVASLLAQDYRGRFRVVLVDDHSSDGTASLARAAAAAAGKAERLAVIEARPLPSGWSGKLWALAEGVRALEAGGDPPDLFLFTDADIEHHRSNLAELVAAAAGSGRDLVSLMVLLRCVSFAERCLIPAFVFFFAMLYPFGWASDPRRRCAAAAGGCILLRRESYRRAGGYERIRGALIDDCALARAVKESGGSILLALTRSTRSLRPYPRLADVWDMVARTAYTQLDHSPVLLLGTVLAMSVTFLAPPVLALGGGAASWLALAAWAAMAIAYLPMLCFYRVAAPWSPLLPVFALVYVAATVDSALRHWRGRGGAWKGRVLWQSQR